MIPVNATKRKHMLLNDPDNSTYRPFQGRNIYLLCIRIEDRSFIPGADDKYVVDASAELSKQIS